MRVNTHARTHAHTHTIQDHSLSIPSPLHHSLLYSVKWVHTLSNLALGQFTAALSIFNTQHPSSLGGEAIYALKKATLP